MLGTLLNKDFLKNLLTKILHHPAKILHCPKGGLLLWESQREVTTTVITTVFRPSDFHSQATSSHIIFRPQATASHMIFHSKPSVLLDFFLKKKDIIFKFFGAHKYASDMR